MTNAISYPMFRAWDSNDGPLVGGKLYSYEVGTSTPANTYSDIDLTIPNSNPVILNSQGEAEVYISGSVKLALYDSDDTLMWTVSEVQQSTLWTFSATEASVLYSSVIYGGTQAAIELALTEVGSTEATLYLAPDNWVINDTSSLTEIPSNVMLKPERGALMVIQTGQTLNINGLLDAGPYQIFSCQGTGTVAFGKATTIYAEWFGAVGDNSTDDYIPIQKAITVGQACGGTVKLLGRTYYSSDTLDIPVTGVNNLCKFTLRGENRSFCDTTNSPDGTVIRFASGKDGICLPTLTAPNNTMGYWAKHITISDIYVKSVATDTPTVLVDTKGFRLGGVQFLQAHNLHAEGFGYGIYLTDCSEVNFTGVTMTQNNYYGLYAQRYSSAPGVGLTDLFAWFDNLVTVGDYIPILLDNPRAVFIKSGENVTVGLTRTDQPRIKITNCWTDAQVHFQHYAAENDEDIEICNVDSSGISVLSFDNCNFESSYNRIVKCSGFFDTIRITGCMMDRTAMAATPRPIVELAATGDDTYARACQIIVEGNSPCWADGAIKNSMESTTPFADFIPRGFQQINPRRELDQDANNYLTAQGAVAFTNSNVLSGLARAYFTTDSVNNGFILTPPRALKGATSIYVIAVVHDNSGANPPGFLLTSTGATPPADWDIPFTVALESYTVGAETFTKYYAYMVMMNKGLIATPGVETVRVYDVWSPGEAVPADNNHTGVESFNVYVNTKEVGWIEPVKLIRAAAPSTAADGYYAVNDIAYELTPGAGAPHYWVCTVAGNPGTWKASANLA